MLLAGIQANSEWTPIKTFAADGKGAETVAIAAHPLMQVILILRVDKKSHVIKFINRRLILRIHDDRGYWSLDHRRAG
jgi:hypothetical protein